MAQSTILAAGQSAATSSDVVIPAGEVRTVGLFVASGNVPVGYEFPLMIDTPGADAKCNSLSEGQMVVSVPGPGTFRVKRNDITASGVNVGVFLEA